MPGARDGGREQTFVAEQYHDHHVGIADPSQRDRGLLVVAHDQRAGRFSQPLPDQVIGFGER